MYDNGPTSNGFYPGDVFYTLHWFAFSQFDGYQDTLHAAFEKAGLDIAAITADLTAVKYFWSRPNLFLDTANRHRLRVVNVTLLDAEDPRPVVAECTNGFSSDDSS